MKPVRYTKLLMVEPAAFGFNPQTADTNRFQQAAGMTSDVGTEARAEFAILVDALRSAGVTVCVARDSANPVKPDAVFPNNWVSFHEDGTVFLYPMHSQNRRAERRDAIIEQVRSELGFIEKHRIDLTSHERQGRFLEGTGSLVLDQVSRVVYACRSPRTDESLVREWAGLMGFEAVLFDACTPDGTPVYHTNVLLWIGERIAGVGLDWVASRDRAMLAARLRGNARRDLLELNTNSLQGFAGNMLEVATASGARVLVMSSAAAASLSTSQHGQLGAAGCVPVSAAIPVIERHGGGSVRCMMAEVPFSGVPS